MTSPPTRPTPEVRLRVVTPADLPRLFEFQTDPASCAMAAVRPRGDASFRALWEKVLTDKTHPVRAILQGEELVGSISCFAIGSEVHVGYWIARAHWGRGIATQALALFLVEIEKRPLHARVASENAGSIRVLERCGFHITGREHSPATERFIECEETLLTLP